MSHTPDIVRPAVNEQHALRFALYLKALCLVCWGAGARGAQRFRHQRLSLKLSSILGTIGMHLAQNVISRLNRLSEINTVFSMGKPVVPPRQKPRTFTCFQCLARPISSSVSVNALLMVSV